MKRVVSIMLSVVIIGLTFSLFSVTTLAAGNNSYATAKKININETVYATSEYSDQYFKFTMEADGHVSIRVNHDYNSTTQYVYLYSYNGNTSSQFLYFTFSKTEEWDESLRCGLKKGDYYVVVESNGTGHAYDFIVNYTKTDSWEKENSNESIKTDNNIKLNSIVYGSITPNSGDDDYFKFVTNKDGYIQLTFNHKYGSTTHDMSVLTYDGNKKTTLYHFSISSSSETKNSEKLFLSAGTYFVYIEGGSSEYNFKVSTVSEPTTTKTTVKPTTTTTQKPTTTTQPPVNTTEIDDITTTTTYIEPSTYTQPADYEYDDEEVLEFENFGYVFINSTIIIVNYSGSDKYVVIPDKINDTTVIGIGDNAFSQTPAKEFEIPATVEQFGYNAFGENEGDKIIHCASGSAAEAYALQNGLQIANNIDIEINNDTDTDSDSDTEGENNPSNIKTILIIICGVVFVAIIICVVLLITKKK